MKKNPARSAAQYRLAEAVLHGTARTKTSMTKKAAQEIIDKTPARLRSEFMKNPARNRKNGAKLKRFRVVGFDDSTGRAVKKVYRAESELDAKRKAERDPGWPENAYIVDAIPLEPQANQGKARKNAGKKSWRKTKKAAHKRLGVKKHAKRNTGRKNPEDQAILAYEDTHGQLPKKDTVVETKIGYHKNLAGMGRLMELVIIRMDGRGEVTVDGFGKDCMLALNEAQTQLFIVGGNQAVDLKHFGIKEPHEKEVLGTCRAVTYYTEKVHLIAKDGGRGAYEHKFSSPRPYMVYDTRNKLLSFAGGGYSIPAEGIKG